MPCPPHFFVWRGFRKKSDVSHVLCEELFMSDGRLHIAKLMLKHSLVWYHWFCWFMNFSFDEIIFKIFQISSDRKRWLIAQGSHAVLKVSNFKIGFQDLEKVLNLATMSLRYWNSIEIPNEKDQSVKSYFTSYLKLDVLKITTVILTSSIIFLSWPQLQIVSFFSRGS